MENIKAIIREIVEQNESLSLDDKMDRETLISHLSANLTEEINNSDTSTFGDGWYDGFFEAKKLNEDKDIYLDDIEEDEVREMSEHAESKYDDAKIANLKEKPKQEEVA